MRSSSLRVAASRSLVTQFGNCRGVAISHFGGTAGGSAGGTEPDGYFATEAVVWVVLGPRNRLALDCDPVARSPA